MLKPKFFSSPGLCPTSIGFSLTFEIVDFTHCLASGGGTSVMMRAALGLIANQEQSSLNIQVMVHLS